MRYLALATDYDETLAHHGKVHDETVRALERVVATHRKLFLVTGRELEDLLHVFPHTHLFEWIVAENGLLLYKPESTETIMLANSPSEEFISQLRSRQIPISVGHTIVSTVRPHEISVLEIIRDLGLDLQLIFNKEAVMMLPAGHNKATGLLEALRLSGLSPHNIVGIGDAENDLAFLGMVECASVVGNALPAIKERADFVTEGERGKGVAELIGRLMDDDLTSLDSQLSRHHVILGMLQEKEVQISPYGHNLLIAGTSGSGKSTLATGIIERLGDKHYQCCIIDPEGDYESLEQAVILGGLDHTPNVKEVIQVLENPETNVVINLVGLPIQDRPSFFQKMYVDLQDYRARTGRPHWIVLDEAHHLMPADWDLPSTLFNPTPYSLLLITVHPEQVAQKALSMMHAVVFIGKTPTEMLVAFAQLVGESFPATRSDAFPPGEALYWNRDDGLDPLHFEIMPNRGERRRHRRKYAEGELSPEHSFYFQGPEAKFKLRAQNLMLFLQIAEGIDHDTWMYHLKQHDYSTWFRECIKDHELAAEAEKIESEEDVGAVESLAQIKSTIESHYTFSPTPPSSSSKSSS
ncbi:MAG: phosphoglycolate phosphatase [Nitrospirales bacterium]|nr:MAG: phosphoglycolate phosphatase [Nitrospirales bacterium]